MSQGKTKPSSIDVDRELWRTHDRACRLAEKVPARERAQIAHQLRETAKIVERMRGRED